MQFLLELLLFKLLALAYLEEKDEASLLKFPLR